jgi:hypothetical protein
MSRSDGSSAVTSYKNVARPFLKNPVTWIHSGLLAITVFLK